MTLGKDDRILARNVARELSDEEIMAAAGGGGGTIVRPTPVERPTNIGPDGDEEIIYVSDRDT